MSSIVNMMTEEVVSGSNADMYEDVTDTLMSCWEDLKTNSFMAESCFFNCQTEEYKINVLEHLDEVENAMTDYAECVFEWLQKIQFVEPRCLVPPLPPGAFGNDSDLDDPVFRSHPINGVTHEGILYQIEQFEITQNVKYLTGLKYQVEVMKECVRIYVESNRDNTRKYILEEDDPDYTDMPAWMFFPVK